MIKCGLLLCYSSGSLHEVSSLNLTGVATSKLGCGHGPWPRCLLFSHPAGYRGSGTPQEGNQTATPIDNLPPELLKAAGDSILQSLAGLLRAIWEKKSTPQDWRTALIIPVLKKGDAAVCSNYRGISLLLIAFKNTRSSHLDRLEAAYTGRKPSRLQKKAKSSSASPL